MPASLKNPCDLPEDEQIPCKCWELLRRNHKFRLTVERLKQLDSRARTEARIGPRAAWNSAWRLLKAVEKHNPIAAVALQWLVPEPLFQVSWVRVPRGLDLKGKSFVATETVRDGEGIVPNPKSRKWRWRKLTPGRPTVGGRLWCRGPRVSWQRSRDKHLPKQPDPFQEWKCWPARPLAFTCNTPWAKAPLGFKRSLRHLLRTPDAYETNFFKNWNLMELVNRAQGEIRRANRLLLSGPPAPVATRAGGSMQVIPQVSFQLSEQEQSRIVMFAYISGDSRQFVVPGGFRSKQHAKAVFSSLADSVAQELPEERDLLGTREFWNDFLAVEAIMHGQRLGMSEAVKHYIYQTKAHHQIESAFSANNKLSWLRDWFRDCAMVPKPTGNRRDVQDWQRVRTIVMPILRKVNAAYRTTIIARLNYLRRLSDATFPIVSPTLFTLPAPHKRRRSQ